MFVRSPLPTVLLLTASLCGASLASCGDGGPGPAPSLDFGTFDATIEAFLTENELDGANVIVVHRDWGVLHQRAFGTFAPDRISLLASASKIISAGVLMRLDDLGLVDVDEPIAQVGAQQNPAWMRERTFTLAQMLSNSSGMVGLIDNPTYEPYLCQYSLLGTLQACGRSIYEADDSADIAPPDTRFRYGGGQWQLAGAIAEIASGQTWAELVHDTYVEPCELGTLAYTNQFAQGFVEGGVDAALSYPDFFTGDTATLTPTRNPSIEGGGYTTVADYGEILLMHLRGGVCSNGRRALSRGAVARMQEDRIGEVYDGDTIDPSLPGYGFGWWVSREEPGVVADLGAYGATPWLDTERGYGVMILLEAEATLGAEIRVLTAPILNTLFDEAR
ncbi:MAG: beta-lactamase family protein [Sandaracinaceae bacterium]|nr:beta-lactamase family protein [Sandaracinaceae bacterium]